jgi:hypothetical protein
VRRDSTVRMLLALTLVLIAVDLLRSALQFLSITVTHTRRFLGFAD